MRAVMVDGDGQPGEATFGARMPGLYTAAYSLRFALKRRGVERRVGMLEGLYWTVDGVTDLGVILGPDRGIWRWTLLISLPDEATDEELAERAREGPGEAAARRRREPADRGVCRGHGGPGAPPRAVRRGAPHDRGAPRRDRRGRPPAARQAPRALRRRSVSGRPREASNPPPPAGRANLKRALRSTRG